MHVYFYAEMLGFTSESTTTENVSLFKNKQLLGSLPDARF